MGRPDDPPLILRVSPRGIVPASSLDLEVLDGMRRGTELEAKVIRAPYSPALRRWWSLMSLLAKVSGRWESKRAASNAVLIELNCIEATALLGGGQHFEPMSLRDFNESQLERLYEKAVFLIEQDILPPGHDVEQLRRDYQKNRIGRAAD